MKNNIELSWESFQRYDFLIFFCFCFFVTVCILQLKKLIFAQNADTTFFHSHDNFCFISGLSTGVVVGIVMGIFGIVVIVTSAFLITLLFRRQRLLQQQKQPIMPENSVYDSNLQDDYNGAGNWTLVRVLSVFLKGACSNPQPHPPTFFKHMQIFVPVVESYL